MLKSFMQYFQEQVAPVKFEIDGRKYTSRELQPVYDPRPTGVALKTLTGLVKYIRDNVDALDYQKLMIVVTDHFTVDLFSAPFGSFQQRTKHAYAVTDAPQLRFGDYMGLENFTIFLQSRFVQSETVATLLKIVGNISDGGVTNFNDDGVTQQVTAKVGITRVDAVPVPNPVILRPFRTFREVEQPASRFVFRMQSGKGENSPTCALFEGDGGEWKNTAVLTVRDWLAERLDDTGISIIA
jgi:hypothetical protein